MHILLANDDGYQAKGIQILYKHLKSLGHRVSMAAPSGQRSAQSHSMTFYNPIQVEKISEDIFSVNGTPADCIAIALNHILKDDLPDIIVSGINHGLNVGIDVNYSGTVGAATEAALMGYKAIAVSLDSVDMDSDTLEKHFLKTSDIVGQILQKSKSFEWPKLEILNINVPANPKSISVAECGGLSLYVPHIEELPSKSQPNLKLYLIGGVARCEPGDMSQDVSLVSQNFVTISFVIAKQSSTKSNENLRNLIGSIQI
jgi:5'-nucleotidase